MTAPTRPTGEGMPELSADLYLILNDAPSAAGEISDRELDEIDQIRQMTMDSVEEIPVFMTCS